MKKKIAIISGTFYPKNSPRSFRTTELVKELTKYGHDITIYIPKNNKEHIVFEKKYNVKIKDLGKPKFPNIDITRGNKYFRLLKRIFKRLVLQLFEYPEIGFMFQVKKKLLKSQDNYDLLISIAAPHTIHWGVSWAISKKNDITKTWIADCGDPFMGSTTDTFRKMFYFKYVEKWWCRKVNYITVPFDGAINGYYKEFHSKIRIIPQGFNFEDVRSKLGRYKVNRIPTFAYSGLLIPGSRDPKPLIDFIVSLKIDFKFIIYTQSLGMLSSYIQKYNDKIEVREYIPRSDLLQILSKMDFVVNFDNNVKTQLPSKLIDYYLIQRPVLSINSFNFDKEVVKQFLRGNYSSKFKYNNPDQYRIENVCRNFLKLV